jgi:hypothetical protein
MIPICGAGSSVAMRARRARRQHGFPPRRKRL